MTTGPITGRETFPLLVRMDYYFLTVELIKLCISRGMYEGHGNPDRALWKKWLREVRNPGREPSTPWCPDKEQMSRCNNTVRWIHTHQRLFAPIVTKLHHKGGVFTDQEVTWLYDETGWICNELRLVDLEARDEMSWMSRWAPIPAIVMQAAITAQEQAREKEEI